MFFNPDATTNALFSASQGNIAAWEALNRRGTAEALNNAQQQKSAFAAQLANTGLSGSYELSQIKDLGKLRKDEARRARNNELISGLVSASSALRRPAGQRLGVPPTSVGTASPDQILGGLNNLYSQLNSAGLSLNDVAPYLQMIGGVAPGGRS